MLATLTTILLIVLVAVIALVVLGVLIYNKLIAARNAYKNAFSQIDVQLTRRYDLIPNLVESVKAYLKHENETLNQVIQARSAAVSGLKNAAASPGDASLMKMLGQADNALNASLGRLMLVVESYPDLKANQTIMQFNEELSSTENRVAFARQAYNDEAMQFNTLSQVFPNNIVASIFGFTPAAFLEAEAAKREVPKVQF